MRNFCVILGALLSFSLNAMAWVNESVLIRGKLQSINEKYVTLMTPKGSIIRLPRHEGDEVWYDRTVYLRRTVNELGAIRILKKAPDRSLASKRKN